MPVAASTLRASSLPAGLIHSIALIPRLVLALPFRPLPLLFEFHRLALPCMQGCQVERGPRLQTARQPMFHTKTFVLINNIAISCPCVPEPTVELASCEQVACSQAEWLLLWAHQLQYIQRKTETNPYKAHMIKIVLRSASLVVVAPAQARAQGAKQKRKAELGGAQAAWVEGGEGAAK